jgi:hypothetical protein
LIETKFIEPYPQLLLSLINNTDQDKMKIIEKRLQDVELDEFEILQGNDILFIDSTHVSKVGSDVNRIFFDILPKIKDGVLIHFMIFFIRLNILKTGFLKAERGMRHTYYVPSCSTTTRSKLY